MANKSSLGEILGRSRTTITAVKENPELAAALKMYGYTPERLAAGEQKLTQVELFFEKQKREYADYFEATQEFINLKTQVTDAYRKDMKLIRIASKQNPTLAKVIPKQVETGNIQEFSKEAVTLYQSLQNNNDFTEALAFVGLNSADFSVQIGNLKELSKLSAIREREGAEAETATEIRDKELDELQEYCKDLRTIAKIASDGNPMLKRIVNEL